MTENTPLTDDEMIELDQMLQANEEYLLVDEAHGFITALLVAKSPLLEGDAWIAGILGDENASIDPKMRDLLLRLRAEAEDALSATVTFEPLIAEIEEEGEILENFEGWCFGFMLAASEDEQVWSELSQSEQELIMPIAKLALLQEDEEADMDEEEYETLVDLIPGSVGALYNHFHGN